MIKTFQRENFIFCFASRNGGVSEDSYNSLNCANGNGDKFYNILKNREIIRKKFSPKKKIIFVNQIHSKKIVEIKNNNPNIKFADAMISSRNDISLAILTADCAPIIVLGKKNFGIIHAGWKGTISGIIETSIEKFLKKGEKLENIFCHVGPHLQRKSFEIKKDFLTNIKRHDINYLKFILINKKKMYFDLSKLIQYIFKKLKIKNFVISKEDTFSKPVKFFSYRYYNKLGIKNCGRQISLVSIKD